MSTPKPLRTKLEDETISRILKGWSTASSPPPDGRDHLLACAAEEQCRMEPFSMGRAIRRFWDLVALDPNQSVIAPSMPNELKVVDVRREVSPFGTSVYALQNAISVGACLVRSN